jgi:hypothetical protein
VMNFKLRSLYPHTQWIRGWMGTNLVSTQWRKIQSHRLPKSSTSFIVTTTTLVTSHSYPRPTFNTWPVHVGFVVNKVALGKVSLPVLHFSLGRIIPPLPRAHISLIYHGHHVLSWQTEESLSKTSRLHVDC